MQAACRALTPKKKRPGMQGFDIVAMQGLQMQGYATGFGFAPLSTLASCTQNSFAFFSFCFYAKTEKE